MTAEYVTTRTHSKNFLTDTNLYWRLSGWLFALVAVAGIIAQYTTAGVIIPGVLVLTGAHNVLHVALAVLALSLGYGRPSLGVQKGIAVVVGAFYMILGLVGFASDTLFGLASYFGLHLEWGEDLFHVLVGAWGMYAGATGND